MLSALDINVKHGGHHLIDNVKMSLQNRINELLNESGKKPSELTKATGLSRATISSWRTGVTQTIEGKNAFAVAKFFNVNPQWVLNGTGDKYEHAEIAQPPSDEFVAIHYGAFRLQAGIVGFSVDLLDDSISPIFLSEQLILKKSLKPKNLIASKIVGDSMEPRLFGGDTVVINIAEQTPADGKVFAVNYEGEMIIKRMHRDGGEWYLRSDNPDKVRFPDKLFSNEYCVLIGSVVFKLSQEI